MKMLIINHRTINTSHNKTPKLRITTTNRKIPTIMPTTKPRPLKNLHNITSPKVHHSYPPA